LVLRLKQNYQALKTVNHVLWRALQTTPDVDENIDDWLRQLAAGIRKLYFMRIIVTLEQFAVEPALQAQLKMLECEQNDALACLIDFCPCFPNQGSSQNS